MKHVTDEILLEAIRSMAPEFDSHDLFQALVARHLDKYMLELHEKLHARSPILQAHADIASQLNRHFFAMEVEGIDKVLSESVRGHKQRISAGKGPCRGRDSNGF